MVRFSALVPDATINYIKNPAMRYDTTDWNASGATLTRATDFARFGIASLKVVTTGAALRQGAFYRVSELRGVSEPVTVSAYVRGTGRVRIRLINNPTGSEWASASIQLETDRWYRISVSGFSTGSDDLRLYVETDEKVATARTFYVDGAQLERKSYPTTYCDGDQPGCRWNGLYHNSTSTRLGTTSEGGRWVQLAGEEREAQDLYMTVVSGMGLAPLTNNTQSFALAPGSYFQNTKINARTIVLTFHAKHRVDERDDPVSLAYLHQLRQLLIDVVKPDRTRGGQEVQFEYDDGNTPLYFKARYDGGLEGEWDVRNQFVNSFPLRLLAVSPIFTEDSQDMSLLDFQDVIRPRRVIGRISGRWNAMNGGVNNDVNEIALGTKGEVYICGAFTVANVSGTLDPNRAAHGICYWDGEKWVSISSSPLTGGAGTATINSVDVAPNGNVYVTGDFTNIGGVAANYIAYWNGTTWNALGTGLNSNGLTVRVAPNGDVYVGGGFTTAGGVSCVRIARWDGLQWRRVGQFGGLNDLVQAIEINKDGSTIYVGGDFTDQNGFAASALLAVASYNTATGLFSAMGSGLNQTVYSLALADSGVLYAGGNFTASGSDEISYIGQWNGSAWLPMSSGADSAVQKVSLSPNGNVLAVGAFTRIGSVDARFIALWNGSTFVNLDLNISASGSYYPICSFIDPRTDDIFIGGTVFGANSADFTLISGFTTVPNPGSREINPVVYLQGPGILKWIENQSSLKRIYLNLTLLASEEVFFDFGQGKIESTMRGSLLYALLPGSDFRSFTLLPGDNVIACFMTNDVAAQARMSFIPSHWSMDATQHGENL